VDKATITQIEKGRVQIWQCRENVSPYILIMTEYEDVAHPQVLQVAGDLE
jgi:hypothetical protein